MADIKARRESDVVLRGEKRPTTNRRKVLLEVAFDLTQEAVHLHVFLLVKLLADPRQAGQDDVHEPVRPDLEDPEQTVTDTSMFQNVVSCFYTWGTSSS